MASASIAPDLGSIIGLGEVLQQQGERTSAPRDPTRRLGKRLVDFAAIADDNSLQLHYHKGHLALIQDARTMDREALHKRSMEEVKQAVRPVRAPGMEKQMSVKARLAQIDTAARQNAAELEMRGDVLRHRAAQREDRSASETPVFDEELGLAGLTFPLFKSKEDEKKERLRTLPPIQGPEAESRRAVAICEVKKRLEARGLLPDEEDWAWVERHAPGLSAAAANQTQAAPQRPPAAVGEPPAPAAASSSRFGGQSYSRSAPSLRTTLTPSSTVHGWMVPTMRRRPRLKHDELYPSIKSRIHVIEEHLGATTDALHESRQFTDEVRAIAEGRTPV